MTSNDKPTKLTYWLALVLVAVAVRIVVAFGLFGDLSQISDALCYADQARHMVAGTWNYPNFWPAGRSIALVPFFWAFGTSEAVVKANAITFDIGCVLMAAVLGHIVLRKRSAARLTGWIAVVYPPMVMLSGCSYTNNVTMLSMLLFSSLAIVACRTCLKNKFASLAAWFVSGCALGCAILNRPSAQTVLFFAGVCWIGLMIVRWAKPRLVRFAEHVSWKMLWGSGIVFLLGLLGCVFPVLKHNASLNAGWVLSVNNEMNCLLGNNPYTPHYKTWQFGQGHAFVRPEFQTYMSSFRGKNVPRSAMIREAIRYICERPDIFLLRTVNRIRAFWGFEYEASGNVHEQWAASSGGEMTRWKKAEASALFCAEAGGYCLVMCLAIAGLFLFRKGMDGRFVAFFIAIIFAYQLPYAITHCNGRFHTPLMGFIFCFAALALDEARLGRAAGWPALIKKTWYWVAIIVFFLVQIEYAYWVLAYHGVS
ncbi:MAG: hypothetical protein WCB27_19580 [Thermoguttaceae bacterium]